MWTTIVMAVLSALGTAIGLAWWRGVHPDRWWQVCGTCGRVSCMGKGLEGQALAEANDECLGCHSANLQNVLSQSQPTSIVPTRAAEASDEPQREPQREPQMGPAPLLNRWAPGVPNSPVCDDDMGQLVEGVTVMPANHRMMLGHEKIARAALERYRPGLTLPITFIDAGGESGGEVGHALKIWEAANGDIRADLALTKPLVELFGVTPFNACFVSGLDGQLKSIVLQPVASEMSSPDLNQPEAPDKNLVVLALDRLQKRRAENVVLDAPSVRFGIMRDDRVSGSEVFGSGVSLQDDRDQLTKSINKKLAPKLESKGRQLHPTFTRDEFGGRVEVTGILLDRSAFDRAVSAYFVEIGCVWEKVEETTTRTHREDGRTEVFITQDWRRLSPLGF